MHITGITLFSSRSRVEYEGIDTSLKPIPHKNIGLTIASSLSLINIYLDLSKAFYASNHSIILHKFKFYCIDDISLKTFGSYLSNRKQFVEVENVYSEMTNINLGVPQDSVL